MDSYQRMTDGFSKTVSRTGWQVVPYAWMPNPIHLFGMPIGISGQSVFSKKDPKRSWLWTKRLL
jgi:hypothetical protein